MNQSSPEVQAAALAAIAKPSFDSYKDTVVGLGGLGLGVWGLGFRGLGFRV